MAETSEAAVIPEEWTTSANEAFHVSIAEEEGVFTFHPTFTYPIFGDAEQIFGYKDLKINLVFDSITLTPLFTLQYSSKLDNVEDVTEIMNKFLPENDFFTKESEWEESRIKERESFIIPGEFIYGYESEEGGGYFGIFKTNLKDLLSLKLHLRMQIFVLLFIEAGSYIDETDPQWELFLLYEIKSPKSNVALSFIGFSTTYSYWSYQGFEDFDKESSAQVLKTRKRISQFVILPPYQHKTHGRELYQNIIKLWENDDYVTEITVEDPSEAFDDLRDRCDLARLATYNVWKAPEFKAPIDNIWIKKTQSKYKIDQTEFQRLIELGLLKYLKSDPESIKLYRLQVKSRLYKKNKEALDGLEPQEKKSKIQEVYDRLVVDYHRLLEKVDFNDSFDDNEPSTKKRRI